MVRRLPSFHNDGRHFRPEVLVYFQVVRLTFLQHSRCQFLSHYSHDVYWVDVIAFCHSAVTFSFGLRAKSLIPTLSSDDGLAVACGDFERISDAPRPAPEADAGAV